MIRQLIEELKQTTMVQVVRVVSGSMATIMVVWSVSGPILKYYAGEAIAQVMTDQGVSPEVFKKALQNIEQIQKAASEIHTTIEKRDLEIANVLSNQTAIIAQNVDTKKRLDEIVHAIIQNQFGHSP